MRATKKILTILLSLFLFIFLPLAILSMLVVPLTFIYAKLTDRSYNFICDQSSMLYRLNNLGQWSWVFATAFFLVYLIF